MKREKNNRKTKYKHDKCNMFFGLFVFSFCCFVLLTIINKKTLYAHNQAYNLSTLLSKKLQKIITIANHIQIVFFKKQAWNNQQHQQLKRMLVQLKRRTG